MPHDLDSLEALVKTYLSGTRPIPFTEVSDALGEALTDENKANPPDNERTDRIKDLMRQVSGTKKSGKGGQIVIG
jgi:hypothetical protein